MARFSKKLMFGVIVVAVAVVMWVWHKFSKKIIQARGPDYETLRETE